MIDADKLKKLRAAYQTAYRKAVAAGKLDDDSHPLAKAVDRALAKLRDAERLDVTAKSPRADMMRSLALGGALGSYGFGRYPEKIFATPRHMVTVFAPRDDAREAKSKAQLDREIKAALAKERK